MQEYSVKIGNSIYNRVSKKKAREAYEAGQAVVLCPVKFRPDSPWGTSVAVTKISHDQTFDLLVQSFEVYNCQYPETGGYAAFYVRA